MVARTAVGRSGVLVGLTRDPILALSVEGVENRLARGRAAVGEAAVEVVVACDTAAGV